MTFMIQAFDCTDEGAHDRRLAARAAHFAYMDENIRLRTMLYGAAQLDETGKMIGSVIIADFDSREEVDAWLAKEPYILQNVWDTSRITITPVKTGKSFDTLFA